MFTIASQFPWNSSLIFSILFFLMLHNNSLADFTRTNAMPKGRQFFSPLQMVPTLSGGTRDLCYHLPLIPSLFWGICICEAVGGVITSITSNQLSKHSNRKDSSRPVGLESRILTSRIEVESSKEFPMSIMPQF